MPSRVRIAGYVWMVLVIAASAGCAGRRDTFRSTEISAFEGIWEGDIAEMPVRDRQGAGLVTLQIVRDGSLTASIGGTQCASGTASIHDGLLSLGGTRTSQDYCMPYSLAPKDEPMKSTPR